MKCSQIIETGNIREKTTDLLDLKKNLDNFKYKQRLRVNEKGEINVINMKDSLFDIDNPNLFILFSNLKSLRTKINDSGSFILSSDEMAQYTKLIDDLFNGS